MGEIRKPAEGKTKTKKQSESKSGLTEKQEQEALEQFADYNISNERKYELYKEMVDFDKEIEEKQKKQNKKEE